MPFSLQTLEKLYDYYGWDDFEKLKKEGEKEKKADDYQVKHTTTKLNNNKNKKSQKGTKGGKKQNKKP